MGVSERNFWPVIVFCYCNIPSSSICRNEGMSYWDCIKPVYGTMNLQCHYTVRVAILLTSCCHGGDWCCICGADPKTDTGEMSWWSNKKRALMRLIQKTEKQGEAKVSWNLNWGKTKLTVKTMMRDKNMKLNRNRIMQLWNKPNLSMNSGKWKLCDLI